MTSAFNVLNSITGEVRLPSPRIVSTVRATATTSLSHEAQFVRSVTGRLAPAHMPSS